MDALRSLTVRQRAVIYLTYWDDLAPADIATTLDTSLRTVERDLNSARTRLEETLS
jgi:RNA polymerase sigma factor (sigma-70 family)